MIEAPVDDRQEIARIIDNVLCVDPWIDGKSKIDFPVYPAILTLYTDGKYWIVYHLVGNTVLHIFNIGYAKDPPTHV